jgi:hypothetical protein
MIRAKKHAKKNARSEEKICEHLKLGVRPPMKCGNSPQEKASRMQQRTLA